MQAVESGVLVEDDGNGVRIAAFVEQRPRTISRFERLRRQLGRPSKAAALGEYEPARVALEMAVRVRPDYAVAHENLGDIYARMAAQSYEKAAKLDSGNKSAPLKLKQVTTLLSGAPH